MKLESYGFIGDTHTGALVGLNGSIDWLCLPRFDAPACFAALLGTEENGCWRIAPADQEATSKHRYRQDTMILETEFETKEGVVRVVDCMPPRGNFREVVRLVEGVKGEVAMEMKLIIRTDYGRTVPWVRHGDGGLLAIAGPDALVLRASVRTQGEGLTTVARFKVKAGERQTLVLSWHRSHETSPDPIDALRAVEHTEYFWREWAARCTYRGEWREQVVRSLLTLKALTYKLTGGIVAALTTSLPEEIGGVRNWDYRYCWLRDATFSLYSFMEAGYTEEASAWGDWLLRAVAGDPSQLQIMYGAAGERMLTEVELKHLAGYENSRPVRLGNAASEQFQLDVYGEVVDAMHLARNVGIRMGGDAWKLQRHLIDFVVRHWAEPDEGIWEIRGPRRHFTHSKVMAWVAMDRAVKAVEEYGFEGDLELWRDVRQRIFDDVCAKGFSEKHGAFTQYYGSDRLDASVLMIPLVGFLPATDPRVQGTVEAIQKHLMRDGLVYRYHPDASGDVDGLPPGEGAFLPCSFWLVDCLCLLDRRGEARKLFCHLMSLSNEIGLLAEEYNPHLKRMVGNFPQAFSHVGLVNSAQNLSEDFRPAEHRSAQTEEERDRQKPATAEASTGDESAAPGRRMEQ
ncbi:glycoside hydrolase family 15 protein [Horticoccus luteus]|uniref:Trehalase n=1 Tax=Horticoccus luteus TaxID=2862869 RepID=A0A8F9XGT8_9BACT|nr:glycoside hydrolase family 15 protein [Horticoccus luteus]QYM79597.1 glycoside hydrolase family 15 protein [Horticoccus luteus]